MDDFTENEMLKIKAIYARETGREDFDSENFKTYLTKNTERFNKELRNISPDAQQTPEVPLENKLYNEADMDKALAFHERYLAAPDEGETNGSGFEILHNQVRGDIQEFIEGKIDLTTDAKEKFAQLVFLTTTNSKGEYDELGQNALKKLETYKGVQGKALNVTDKAIQRAHQLDNVQQESATGIQRADKESLSQDGLARQRSLDGDTSEAVIDRVKVTVLHSMKLVSDEDLSKAFSSQQENIEVLNNTPKLNATQEAEFNQKFVDLTIGAPQLFSLIPPSVLTQAYEHLKQEVNQEKTQETSEKEINKDKVSENKATLQDKSARMTAQQKLESVTARIDDLSAQFFSKIGYFYADPTNIADVEEGYGKMFDARTKDLSADKPEEKAKLDIIQQNRSALKEFTADYDNVWNLTNVTEKDAEKLNKNYDTISKMQSELSVSDDVMKNLARYEFLDEDGKPIPQFIDPETKEKTATWKEGAIVDPDGKLADVVLLAKNDVLMQNLSSSELSKETMQKEIDEVVQFKLFAINNAQEVSQGFLEDPKKFVDPKFFKEFQAKLANPEAKMQISAKIYDKAIDNQINQVAGFANRLSQKIGNDKPVLSKLFDPISHIDKRAQGRMTNGNVKTKGQARIEVYKRTAKGMLTAATISAAVVGVSTLGADALGMADGRAIIGMGLGMTMAIGATAKNIYSWRKAQKAEGKPYGIKAFLKDKRMLSACATTALGCSAMGFAAVGMPNAAMLTGGAALALGSGGAGLTTFRDLRASGISKTEATLTALASTGLIVGSGFLGRGLANAGIDYYNEHNPTNTNFQHEEVTGKTEDTYKETITYKDGIVEDAQRILGDNWYKDNPELLQQRVDAIQAYNAEHGTNIDPHRYLLAAHDAGALTPDNNLNHVQGGDNVHTGGNHKVFGAEWSQTTGVSQTEVNNLANSVTPNGVTITPESLEAFQKTDEYIGMKNVVGSVPSNPHQNDGVLGFNSQRDADGVTNATSEGGNQFSTYANHDGVFEKTQELIKGEDIKGMVRNEGDGLGALGFWHKPLNGVRKLKARAGSLLDKITGKTDKIAARPQNNLAAAKAKEIPVENKAAIAKAIPVENKAATIDPKKLIDNRMAAQKPAHTPNEQKLLIDEYKLIHGIAPDDKELNRYVELVKTEQKTENAELAQASFGDYLKARREEFDEKLAVRVDPIGKFDEKNRPTDEHGARVFDIQKKNTFLPPLNKTREAIWKSNATQEDVKNMTLKDFQKTMTFVTSNGADHQVVPQSRDTEKGPIPYKRKNEQHRGEQPSPKLIDKGNSK
ncbi:MAG: hypothetical protein PHE89_03275 [Alphaproteobacteria bacterium]|nr:hypothetical protein [Alphaproteobacteria bacterium]